MRKLLIVVAGFMLSACATKPFVPGDMPPMDRAVVMLDAVSPDDSSVRKDEASSMIVLTLAQDVHSELTSGQRVAPTMTMGVNINTDSMPINYGRFLNELKDRYGLTRVADWPLESINARCLVFRTIGLSSRDDVIAALSEDPRVEKAQALNLFTTLADDDENFQRDTYNDPFLDLQHGFRSMRVEPSHRWATGNNVTVAVVDTGVDITHPDLKERITLARNFVDRDSAVFNSDVHGTAVSGVIAATGNNAQGIVGVAPQANLLALKGCWQQSESDTRAVCSSFTLAKSIDFAVLQNVEVMNLSLTGPPDPLLEALVKNAVEKGISVVGAFNANQPENFPTYIDGVLSVSDSNEKLENESANDLVDVKAPGKKVFSATPDAAYDFFSGSSISAAQVSGLVALLRERRPHLSADDILNLMQSTSFVSRGTTAKLSVNACLAVASIVGADNQQCVE